MIIEAWYCEKCGAISDHEPCPCSSCKKIKLISVDDVATGLAKLDWTKVLAKAIESRLTSWNGGMNAVNEWKNASDQIYIAVKHALEEAGIIPDYWKLEGEK